MFDGLQENSAEPRKVTDRGNTFQDNRFKLDNNNPTRGMFSVATATVWRRLRVPRQIKIREPFVFFSASSWNILFSLRCTMFYNTHLGLRYPFCSCRWWWKCLFITAVLLCLCWPFLTYQCVWLPICINFPRCFHWFRHEISRLNLHPHLLYLEGSAGSWMLVCSRTHSTPSTYILVSWDSEVRMLFIQLYQTNPRKVRVRAVLGLGKIHIHAV